MSKSTHSLLSHVQNLGYDVSFEARSFPHELFPISVCSRRMCCCLNPRILRPGPAS